MIEPNPGIQPAAGLCSPHALARAEAQVRASTGAHDAMDRFAQAMARLWPVITHAGVLLSTPEGPWLHPLIPQGAPTPFPLEEGSVWERALCYGEMSLCTGMDLLAALEASHGTMAMAGRHRLTALAIVPLAADGRILGAASLGVATRGGHWPVNAGQMAQLVRALSRRLLHAADDAAHGASSDSAVAYSPSPAALIHVDEDCRIDAMNTAAGELLGFTLSEARGQRVCDLLGLAPMDEAVHAADCPISRVVHGHGEDSHFGPHALSLTVGGERIPAVCAAQRADGPNHAAGASIALMRLRPDEHIQERRRQVLARLLHDLRTPLSGIGLAMELLDPETTELPPGIIDAAHMHHADLLRYVSELADYASIEVGTRLPSAHRVALNDVLEIVLWRLKPYTQRRRQQLRVRVDSQVERPLLTSEYHLQQALTAAMFDVSSCAAKGTVVQVGVRLGDGRAELTISGTGCTIRPEEVAILVDPYLRASPHKHTKGLMSLAAAKRALEHYGGALNVALSEKRLSITLTAPLA